ncbi:MAG TPA: ADOP family duplicated permease [Bryobacteraceae bacterium]
MSYKVWQSRFAGDPGVIGKTFTLDGAPRTLIGVMPRRFAWWGADLWIPTTINHGETDLNAPFFLLGHLKPGLTLPEAQAEAAILAQRLSKTYPKLYPKKFSVHLSSLVDNVVGKFRETIFTLLAAVGLLLLIACANVANLLLAKATAREKEFAIRASLGAGRVQIVRQLLVESLLLAFMGAAAGCLLAWAGLKALVAALPKFTFPDEAAITLNGRVLAATIVTAVVTALIFGFASAVGLFGRSLSEPLKAAGRGNSGFRRGQVRNVLIVGEVALSLILLIGAGLLMRSFAVQRQVDLGLRSERLLTSQVFLGKRYKTADEQSRFFRELMSKVQALPGIVNASVALDFPPYGGVDTEFEAAGVSHSEKWKGQMAFVDAQFVQTIGARLLRGRMLTQADITAKRKVAVVNQVLAAKFFSGKDPLGKQIQLTGLEKAPEPVSNPWFEVVGVISDMKNHGLREAILPEAYAPYTLSSYGGFIVYLRAAGNPKALATALEGTVLAIDKGVVPQQTNTLDETLDLFEFSKPRFGLQLFSVFAAIGLILVTVGVYSVVSYTVSQQSREIGIRMALGATGSDVRGWVMRSSMRFIVIGVALGILAAFFLMRIVASQIWGVSTHDPVTLFGVSAVLIAVGVAACYVPSLHATRVNPVISLRCE